MVVLRTVANLWRVERQNRNAEAIADRAGKLYDKFVSFVGDMQNLGTRLGNARACYDDTMNKLATGNGNVVRQIEQLKEMGAKASKSIPTALTAMARNPKRRLFLTLEIIVLSPGPTRRFTCLPQRNSVDSRAGPAHDDRFVALTPGCAGSVGGR